MAGMRERFLVCVCVWVEETENRKEEETGQKCPIGEEEDASESEEERGRNWPTRGRKGGKGGRVVHGGTGGMGHPWPARPKLPNRRVFAVFVQFSDKLSQGTTPNHHLGLPSSRFTPRIIEFRCDFAKNTPTGAATLLFKFSKFWNVFFQLLTPLAFL